MMRSLFFILLCAGLCYGLQRMERAGSFHEINRNFLSWLSANTKGTTAAPSITILKIDKDDNTFDWPPTPIDFATMLNRLKLFSPKAVAIEPVLDWKDPNPQSLSSVVRMSEGLSPLLLGVQFEINPEANEPLDASLLAEFEPIENVSGDISKLPRFTGVHAMPGEALRKLHQMAHTYIDLSSGEPTDQDLLNVPLLARHGDKVFASFVLKAVLLKDKIPMGSVEVRLGDSVKAGGLNIPIDYSGHLAVSPDWESRIPALSASVLMVGPNPDPSELGPDESLEDLETLHDNLILIGRTGEGVRGFDRPGGGTITRSEILASAIAAIQSGRFQIRLSNRAQYITWGMTTLVGLLAYMLIRRKAAAMVFGGLSFLAIVIASLLTFQSTSHWCPPTIPFALVLLSTALAFLTATRHHPQQTNQDAGS